MTPGDNPIQTLIFAVAVGAFLMVRKTATGTMGLADDPTYAGTGRTIWGATTEAGAAADKRAAVQVTGDTYVYAGATLTPGVHRELTVNASGQVVPRGDVAANALVAIFVGEKTYTAGQLAPVRLVEVR